MSEKEKMNVNTAPAVDTSTGTAEDVEAIMKKYDRESNTRIWEGVPKKVVRYLLAAFALLMVYMNLFANWDERVRRSLFVGIVIILSFLVYPAKKGSTKKNHIPIYDIVLMVLGAGAYFYFVINFKTIIGHATRISQLEVIVGIIGILVLAETCRRVVGIPIMCVATVFIGYAFYSGLGAGRAFPQVLNPSFTTCFIPPAASSELPSASAPRISRCLSCSAHSWRPPGSRSSLSSWPTPWRALPPEVRPRWPSSPRPSAEWYPEVLWGIQLPPAP